MRVSPLLGPANACTPTHINRARRHLSLGCMPTKTSGMLGRTTMKTCTQSHCMLSNFTVQCTLFYFVYFYVKLNVHREQRTSTPVPWPKVVCIAGCLRVGVHDNANHEAGGGEEWHRNVPLKLKTTTLLTWSTETNPNTSTGLQHGTVRSSNTHIKTNRCSMPKTNHHVSGPLPQCSRCHWFAPSGGHQRGHSPFTHAGGIASQVPANAVSAAKLVHGQ